MAQSVAGIQAVPNQSALPASRNAAAENYVLAAILVVTAVIVILGVSEHCRHWFIMSAAACAMLTLPDIIAWARKQVDTFDPKPIAALLLLHGFFIAPCLHMGLDAHDRKYMGAIHDWGRWFGQSGAITAVGLLVYKLTHYWSFQRTRPPRTVWVLDEKRFVAGLTTVIGISAIGAGILLVAFGGVHKEVGLRQAPSASLFHLSWLMMIGDPLPMLVAFGLVHVLRSGRRDRSMTTVMVFLSVFLVAQFALLGLRGSRSATIFAVFQVACLIHYRWRRIPLGWILAGVTFLGIGGYYYKFFKALGTQGFQALASGEKRKALERKIKYSPMRGLLGDLSRAEIQAFEVYRLSEHPERYELRWGWTYAASVLTVIPRALWPEKPSGKQAAATDLQLGQGTWKAGAQKSSRVFGLAGEAMLNFGRMGVPLLFALFGTAMGWYRRKMYALQLSDARFFLVPIFTLTAFLTVVADSDNLSFGLLRAGTLPILLILYSSTRTPVRSL